MTTEIVFETHSISTDNEAGIATGWLGGRLSEAGRRYARKLGARRRSERVDAVYTSDLRRAVETAGIAFAATDIDIRRDRRLRECDYGKLNGMPVSLLERERHHHVDDPWPEGESYRQVVLRVQDFLRDLSSPPRDGRFVVIGHTATRWALDHLAHGVPLETLVSSPFHWQQGWAHSFSQEELRLLGRRPTDVG